MEYRKIKGTDLRLSVIGTGCWAFGGGDYWGAQNQKDTNDVVNASVDGGINYFDTAEGYNEGRSETALGEALKFVSREKLVIGTKVSPSNASPGTLEKHCEASLQRLGTDYIDIYMIHWPVHPHSIRHFTKDEQIINRPPRIEDALEIMQKLRNVGKIRYFGLSNFSFNRLKSDIPANMGITVNELPYNLLCRAIEYETLPYCLDNGIGVIGYMTLLQGILTGKYTSLNEIPEWQRRTRHFNATGTPLCRHGEKGFENETEQALKAIAGIASKSGYSMAEIATKWVITSGITCALAGARNVRQLEENLKAAESEMDVEILNQLNLATLELKEKMGNHFDYYENPRDDRTL